MHVLLIDDGLIERRAALLQSGELQQLTVEHRHAPSLVRTIWRGRVRRIEPKANVAFVDIGLAEAGWLNAADAAPGRTGPIGRLLHEGEAVLVQATRDPIGGKGVRLTRDIVLPGRFVLFTPFAPKVVVSRRFGDTTRREQLLGMLRRETAEGGAILRGAAATADEADIRAELQRLRTQWQQIGANNAAVPAELWRDAGPIGRALREMLPPGPVDILVNSPAGYAEARDWLTRNAPGLIDCLQRFTGPGALFDREDAEAQVAAALSPQVTLSGGGQLHIAETEGLTAIDVDSGDALAGSALETNLRACREIARQLRLREIGGLVVIDFIHRKSKAENRQIVAALRAAFAGDPANTQVLEMSALGLVELVRQRRGPSLGARLNRPCPACDAAGRMPTLQARLAELARAAERQAATQPGGHMAIACAPELAAALDGELAQTLAARIGVRLSVAARPAAAPGWFEVNPA